MSKEYKFTVENIESGQRRPYGDSYFTYKVKSDSSEFIVKQFCTKVLQSAPIDKSERKAHIEEKGFGGNFTTYVEKFEKIGNNLYRYEAISPSTH